MLYSCQFFPENLMKYLHLLYFFIKKCVFKTIPIIIIALWHNCMNIQLICTPKSHYHNVKNIYNLNKQRYWRIWCIAFTSQKVDAINKETYKKYIINIYC